MLSQMPSNCTTEGDIADWLVMGCLQERFELIDPFINGPQSHGRFQRGWPFLT
jgi:hypothetical protein